MALKPRLWAACVLLPAPSERQALEDSSWFIIPRVSICFNVHGSSWWVMVGTWFSIKIGRNRSKGMTVLESVSRRFVASPAAATAAFWQWHAVRARPKWPKCEVLQVWKIFTSLSVTRTTPLPALPALPQTLKRASFTSTSSSLAAGLVQVFWLRQVYLFHCDKGQLKPLALSVGGDRFRRSFFHEAWTSLDMEDSYCRICRKDVETCRIMFGTAAWWFAGWLGPDEVHALGFCKAPSGLKAPCVGVWKNVKDPDVVMWWWRYCIYLYLHYSSCTFATFPIRHLASGFCAFFWSQATAGCEDLLVLLASRLRHEPERKAQMLALMTLWHWTYWFALNNWTLSSCVSGSHRWVQRSDAHAHGAAQQRIGAKQSTDTHCTHATYAIWSSQGCRFGAFTEKRSCDDFMIFYNILWYFMPSFAVNLPLKSVAVCCRLLDVKDGRCIATLPSQAGQCETVCLCSSGWLAGLSTFSCLASISSTYFTAFYSI